MNNSDLVIIGYSGHSYVCLDIVAESEWNAIGYCDNEEKEVNPYGLKYLGHEKEESGRSKINRSNYFIGIGNNIIRYEICDEFSKANNGKLPVSLVSKSASISKMADVSRSGVLICPNVIVNSMSKVSQGCILNSGCIIEHECKIDSYVHIAPGAVLAGNVTIGAFSFVGANSVIKEGVNVGMNVTIGAGSVVLEDVFDNAVVVGNPARVLKYKNK